MNDTEPPDSFNLGLISRVTLGKSHCDSSGELGNFTNKDLVMLRAILKYLYCRCIYSSQVTPVYTEKARVKKMYSRF